MAEQLEFDIVIVGGGMVGASLATALSGQGLRLAVVEAHPFTAADQPCYDDRSIALSYGSSRILETMGVWSALDRAGVCPIETIHISDRGHLGTARIHAGDEGVQALGYVVENRVLGQVFGERLAQLADVTLLTPAAPTALDISAERARLLLRQDGRELDLRCRLVVAADGGHSLVREWQGIETYQHDYGQTAIITNVSSELPHRNVAYERFTTSGPLALLPMTTSAGQGRSSLVWTARNHEVATIMGWDEAQFREQLTQRFGPHLGRITQVGKRSAYPLRLMQVREAVRPRLAVIGNAAHSVHPVAGQGFNLGLRDVATLAQVVVDVHRRGGDIGQLPPLQGYGRWRRHDTLRTLFFTDALVRTFSTPFAPLALARNLGLIALDVLPPVKRLLARQAMGMVGRQTRLARGLPL